MEFKKITLGDRDKLLPFLTSANELTCEISFVNLLLWQPLYNNCYCIDDGILYLKSYSEHIETFSLPFGDMAKGVEKIKEYSHTPYPTFWAQSGERFDRFISLFGDGYDVIESRNEFDYIYNSTDLITLSGKKYHSKRNHISAFSKQFDWHYEDITDDNIDRVRRCADIWYSQSGNKMDDELRCEMQGVYMMLENMEALGVEGGAITVDDTVVAFTLGSPINQSIYNIHIEKAINGFDTAYTVINREFAAHHCEGYKYINREDDLGLEGLRKSKLSYRPEILLPKYVLTKKEDL